MISDTLHDAIVTIRSYLYDDAYEGVYEGALRTEILHLLGQMSEIREKLDAFPIPALPTSDQNEVQKDANP